MPRVYVRVKEHKETLSAKMLLYMFKAQKGKVIGEFDKIVRHCRNCDHAIRDERCELYRIPQFQWEEGKECTSYKNTESTVRRRKRPAPALTITSPK